MGMIFLLKGSALFILCQFALVKSMIKNRIINSFLRLPSSQLTWNFQVFFGFWFFFGGSSSSLFIALRHLSP